MAVTERTPAARRSELWPVRLYRTGLGKKYVMALTGVLLLGYVLFHMLGNLKLYLGPEAIDTYAEGLRELGEPFTPRTFLLWVARILLAGAFFLHVHASYGLTMMNQRARARGEQGPTSYAVADYASRTMRWSGVIVGLFVLYHLADLTWGFANPEFVRGEVYHNVVASFSRWPVALLYVVANVALALHIYHGAWSLFQSMGWNHPRFNHWRRPFAAAFAWVILVGNVSFPVAVLTGVVS